MRKKIRDLPLGTRFRIIGYNDLWVLLSYGGQGLIARWEGLDARRSPTGVFLQSMCCIVEENQSVMDYEVEVREEDNQ